MSTLTADILFWKHPNPEEYYYKVSIDFPGTYEGGTVGYDHTESTEADENGRYPITITFDTSTQTSTSGTTSVEVDVPLTEVPWVADPSTEDDGISIDVALQDENASEISGGGVTHQGQADTVSRPLTVR